MSTEFTEVDKARIDAHFPTDYESIVDDYVINGLLKHSRYLFVDKVDTEYIAHCSHCKESYEVDKPKQKSRMLCPHCGSSCEVRLTRYKNSKLVDRGYFEYFFKSQVDPNVIVALGIYVWRDYRNGYANIKNSYSINAQYVFDPVNGPEMILKWYTSSERKKTVFSLSSRYQSIQSGWSNESIEKAIEGTSFRWSTWDQYSHWDITKFFALYSKYPIVEYLTKLGLSEIVEGKIYGRTNYRCVNWKAKDVFAAVRMSKNQFEQIKKANVEMNVNFLKLYQAVNKFKYKESIQEINTIVNHVGYNLPVLLGLMKYLSPTKIKNYIEKQIATKPNISYFSREIHTWEDYIKDCITLGMDLTNEIILMPRDLQEAHQNTIDRIKTKANKLHEAKFKKRAKSLERYCYEHKGLFIRPVKTTNELEKEGKMLRHCVGGYAKSYAAGETSLFVIRDIKKPGTPFYTVEIKKGQVCQVRGLKNCEPTKEVSAFMKKFEAIKLKPKNQSKQIFDEGGIACQI